jgi:hypothetical protein
MNSAQLVPSSHLEMILNEFDDIYIFESDSETFDKRKGGGVQVFVPCLYPVVNFCSFSLIFILFFRYLVDSFSVLVRNILARISRQNVL